MREEILNSLPESLSVQGNDHREIWVNDEIIKPDHSQKIINHSPDGFNWGYRGSGPAQLALAILMEFMPVEDAVEYYQYFKEEFVAELPQDDFCVTINLKEIIKKINSIKTFRKNIYEIIDRHI